tara:strand:- start:2089 stop:3996 length:1908 start_codon:yes stop_codon:yes gene_type:complete
MSNYRPNNDQVEFTLPKQGYAAFDAASLKTLIIERLNTNNVFTDQNYEGSNINAFIDVVSYAYHVLLFYLNNTSNESLFSESQIYENINRIVKSIDYKPVGVQTPALTISAIASDQLTIGTYTIPRYSYIDIGGFIYSFNNDTTFVKTTSADENLEQITGKTLLYQGQYIEYPVYKATGEPNETLVVVPGDNISVDHFNIDVYIQEGGPGGTFHKYDTITSMLFARPTSRNVEIRLNENKRYEIRFGNDINGRQLRSEDMVYIYYLSTEGTSGEVSENDAVNKKVKLYTSTQLEVLKQSSNIRGDGVVYINQPEADNVLISNSEPSTKFYEGETVEDVRSNAPQTFSSQYRLVSISDYESYIISNFSNFVSGVKAVDNNTYLDNHIKYYYDLGLKSPSLESRVLMNQVQFSSSCTFNNLYIYVVPRLDKTTTLTKRNNYLTTAQKELIINRLSQTKTVTCDPIIMDPVYVTVDIGTRGVNEPMNTQISDQTKIMLVQEDTSRVNSNDIIQKVGSILKEYFSNTNATIGMSIDLTKLSNEILSIQGITTFYTYRPDLGGTYVEGLSLMIWNPVYEDDILQTTQNYNLPIFKFPFFRDVDNIGDKIQVFRASDANSILSTTLSINTDVNSSDMIGLN